MREDDSNWFSRWEEELPPLEELTPLTQTLITPDLALAFDIRNPTSTAAAPAPAAAATTTTATVNNHQNPPPSPPPPPPPAASPSPPNHLAASQPPSSAEFGMDSSDLGSGAPGDEPARTLKRPRLVWTPQLHKRFVDAVAHLGIKNAVPKTIMQLMNVDGLTRENVASHLQKYRLYLKRMQGLSSGGAAGANGAAGAAGLGAGSDAATDHLFASSPVPAHFLHPGRPNSDHFLPFVPVAALQHHHHQQQIAAAAAAVGHPQLQSPYHRQMGHFGSPPNGQFEHPFLARQTQQPVHRMGTTVHSTVPGYVEDLESASGNGGRKVLTLFPTGDD